MRYDLMKGMFLAIGSLIVPSLSTAGDCVLPPERQSGVKEESKKDREKELATALECFNARIRQIDADLIALKGVLTDYPKVSAYDDDFLNISLIAATRSKQGGGKGVALTLLATNKTENDLLVRFRGLEILMTDETGEVCKGFQQGISDGSGGAIGPQDIRTYTVISPEGKRTFSMQSQCSFSGSRFNVSADLYRYDDRGSKPFSLGFTNLIILR